MKTTELGKSGIIVPRIAVGCVLEYCRYERHYNSSPVAVSVWLF